MNLLLLLFDNIVLSLRYNLASNNIFTSCTTSFKYDNWLTFLSLFYCWLLCHFSCFVFKLNFTFNSVLGASELPPWLCFCRVLIPCFVTCWVATHIYSFSLLVPFNFRRRYHFFLTSKVLKWNKNFSTIC